MPVYYLTYLRQNPNKLSRESRQTCYYGAANRDDNNNSPHPLYKLLSHNARCFVYILILMLFVFLIIIWKAHLILKWAGTVMWSKRAAARKIWTLGAVCRAGQIIKDRRVGEVGLVKNAFAVFWFFGGEMPYERKLLMKLYLSWNTKKKRCKTKQELLEEGVCWRERKKIIFDLVVLLCWKKV